MGITNTENYSVNQNQIANTTKVLGNPARISILEAIVQIPGCTCGDLVEIIPLSQSTISQHLKDLKIVGLIRGEVRGSKVFYYINQPTWEELIDRLFNLITPKH